MANPDTELIEEGFILGGFTHAEPESKSTDRDKSMFAAALKRNGELLLGNV